MIEARATFNFIKNMNATRFNDRRNETVCKYSKKNYSKAASHGNENRTMDFVSLNGFGYFFFFFTLRLLLLVFCCFVVKEIFEWGNKNVGMRFFLILRIGSFLRKLAANSIFCYLRKFC